MHHNAGRFVQNNQTRIFKNDVCRFATQLQCQSPGSPGQSFLNDAANLCRTGESDLVDSFMSTPDDLTLVIGVILVVFLENATESRYEPRSIRQS